mmetsp:Transcript_44680/g.136315  ORF Transcript_44680/g.136315 Transcript_44680/m.136315 type:complete len:205 (-) Transcript_44680:1474-2088(-)
MTRPGCCTSGPSPWRGRSRGRQGPVCGSRGTSPGTRRSCANPGTLARLRGCTARRSTYGTVPWPRGRDPARSSSWPYRTHNWDARCLASDVSKRRTVSIAAPCGRGSSISTSPTASCQSRSTTAPRRSTPWIGAETASPSPFTPWRYGRWSSARPTRPWRTPRVFWRRATTRWGGRVTPASSSSSVCASARRPSQRTMPISSQT